MEDRKSATSASGKVNAQSPTARNETGQGGCPLEAAAEGGRGGAASKHVGQEQPSRLSPQGWPLHDGSYFSKNYLR